MKINYFCFIKIHFLRNLLLCLFLLILLVFSNKSTAQVVNNGSFENINNGGVTFGAMDWVTMDNVVDWNASHGGPHFYGSLGSCYAQTGIQSLAFDLNVNPSVTLWYGKGSGAFTSFNFISGRSYRISYWINTTHTMTSCISNQDGGRLNIYACNGLVKYATNGMTNSTGVAFPPSISSKQLIDNSVTTVSGWQNIVKTFTANANYSQLWIYPEGIGSRTLTNDDYYVSPRLSTYCN
jgi:hypothetical protein